MSADEIVLTEEQEERCKEIAFQDAFSELALIRQAMKAGIAIGHAEAAKDAQKAVLEIGGWITWGGGECPVPATTVRVRCRDGSEDTHKAETFFWPHEGTSGDIIAYKVLS